MRGGIGEGERGAADLPPPPNSSLAALALPLAADQAASFAASVVAAAVVAATLEPTQTGALFLGRAVTSATGLAPVLGSLTAIETFAGAAHGAAVDGPAGARGALGLVLQRSLAVAAGLAAAAAALWAAAAAPQLAALGQDPALSAPAARFVTRWAPALTLWGASEACRRTAVAQGAARATAVVSVAVLLTARPLTRALVTRFGLDGSDAADATMAALSAGGMVAVLAALDAGRPPRDRAWAGLDLPAALSPAALRVHAAVAVPAALLVCLSWWAGQAVVVLAGTLPAPADAVAAAGALLNVRAASYMAADGLATAAAVLTARELGRGRPRAAAGAARAAAAGGAALGAVAAAAVLAGRHAWAGALCPAESACASIAVASAPALAVCMLAEAAAGAAAGGLRGCGRQAPAALASLACAWCVGLPLQAWLALAPPAAAAAAGLGPGVPGLLAGGAASSVLLAGCVFWLAARTDWFAEADRAAAAVAASGAAPLLGGEEGESDDGGP